MSGWTSTLAHGLALHLAAAGVGTYRASGAYTATETGIIVGAVPPDPPRIIVLTPYPLNTSTQADELVGLQVRARSAAGDPRDALDLVDAVHDVIGGATHLDLAGAIVHQIQRRASAPMGTDANGRYEHADTYHLQAHHPTPHRI
ncbi:minor capsid protein [Saccharopolyspora sp. NPDC002376]